MILSAHMSGIPAPKVRWFHNGDEVRQSANINIETGTTYTTLNVSRASKEQIGTYKVTAENKVGGATAEFTVDVKDRPDVPRDIHSVEYHQDFIAIAWDKPASDGGASITGYVVEKREGSRKMWTNMGEVGADTCRYKATKLREGSEYYFRVAAINSIGTGPFGTMDDSVTAKLPFTVPNPPRNLHLESVTKKTCVIVWDKPDFDGGSPVIGYFVEKRQAYGTRYIRINRTSVRDTMYKVKDLVEDEEYEFRVVAENEAGESKPSETTGSFTAKDPFDPPGRPGKPNVNLHGNAVTLTWDAPFEDGRSPITNYIIEMKSMSDIRWKVASQGQKVTALTYIVSDLKADTDYEFRISAENRAGVGVPSAPSNVIRYGK